MNEKTQTTKLQYINRDGQPDTSFVLAVKREQAKRYATQLTKQALKGSVKLTWYILARVSDDINHTTRLVDEYNEFFGITDEAEQTVRRRNMLGQYV